MRSSAFLAFALNQIGVSARVLSGRASPESSSEAHFGLRVRNQWEPHAWVQTDRFLVDITADQFEQPPVLVLDGSDQRYRAGTHDGSSLRLTMRGEDAIAELARLWTRRS